MSKPLSVTVLNDGPLKISGDHVRLRFAGESIPTEDGQDLYICRCGKSQNAPFCDGSHSKVGFSGSCPDRQERAVRVWEGNTIRTFFNSTACMHAFYCKPLKELRKLELEGNAEAADEIARVVQTCPSGALTFEIKEHDSVSHPETNPVADVNIIEGGEVRIQCAFDINAELHERQPNDRATLCRCGQSKNKPWCDGSHSKMDGFR